VKSKLRAQDFVFGKNQKKNADGNAKHREGLRVAGVGI